VKITTVLDYIMARRKNITSYKELWISYIHYIWLINFQIRKFLEEDFQHKVGFIKVQILFLIPRFSMIFSHCVVHPSSPRGPTLWQQHNGSPFSTLLTRHLIKWCETRGPAQRNQSQPIFGIGFGLPDGMEWVRVWVWVWVPFQLISSAISM